MRQKRAKSYKKQMTVYTHTFKFREPFQTLVDNELILNCAKASFDIAKGINRTIQGEAKPMITQCCIQALYETNNQGAIDIAKRFERRRCNHPPSKPVPPAECIESITNIDGENKHRYIVASQDYELRKKLRKVAGVPLIFMNRSVMVMEPLSHASARYSERFERMKLTAGLNDKTVGLTIENENKNNGDDDEGPKKKKRKGPKQPNPLSIKKKKTKTDDTATTTPNPEKKRRRRHHSKNAGESNEDNNSSKPESKVEEVNNESS